MANSFFKFKQFTIMQANCAMKVTTDSCLFGAWAASKLKNEEIILDIGGGTGLLSLMLAQASNAKIHSVELENECYAQLIDNINASGWKTNISAFEGDIKLFDAGMKYDMIISNPPFYEQQLKSPIHTTNLARHSDQLSLMEFFTHAERLLNGYGKLFVLMPFYRKNELLTTAEKFNLFSAHIADVKQTPKHEPFRTMIIFSRDKKELTTETITIKADAGEYTERFREILKDYYLIF